MIKKTQLMGVALSLLLGLFAGCDSKPPPPNAPQSPLSTTEQTALLTRLYALRPDRRFLLAMAELHSKTTGLPPLAVEVQYQPGGWQLTYRQQLVGTLPDYPDFTEAWQLLMTWGKTLPRRDLPAAATDLASPADFFTPMTTLQALDRQWQQQPNRALLQQAARSQVGLALQQLDYLEQDTLTAKALALLALNQLYEQPLPEETALLADRMGYSNQAFAGSASLPTDSDAWAYFRQFEPQPTSVRGRYLQLLKAADQYNAKRWESLRQQVQEGPGLAFMMSNLALNNFAPRLPEAETLPLLVLLRLAQEAEPHNPDLAQLQQRLTLATSEIQYQTALTAIKTTFKVDVQGLIPAFETYLTQRLHGLDSTAYFLDATTLRAYYEGFFYSTLYLLALHELELQPQQRHSLFLPYLQSATTATAQALLTWEQQLAQNSPPLQPQDFSRVLGSEALEHQYHAYLRQPKLTTTQKLQASQRFISQLDSRISHRSRLFAAMQSLPTPPELRLKLAHSIATQGSAYQPHISAWYDCYTGDWLNCRTRFNQPGFLVSAQLKLLNSLQTLNPELVHLIYQELSVQYPEHGPLARQFSRFWMQQRNLTEAGLVLENWLYHQPDPTHAEAAKIKLQLAEILYQDQRLADAQSLLKTLPPTAETAQLLRQIETQRSSSPPH